jgi:hypothetical protein
VVGKPEMPVDGYRYVNDYAGAHEDLEVNLVAMEPQIGDLFGATSLHSVFADDWPDG